jgi:N-acetylglucosamine-6-phosphate deacetylase
VSCIEGYGDVVKIVTLAPELDGAMEFVNFCNDNGIICSIGHTAATFAQCLEALAWGAKSFTHSYNAMSPLNHREPGAVGALLTSNAYAELICDNIHVHPTAQKVLSDLKGNKTVLITDALRACLTGEGKFTLGNLKGEVKDGAAFLDDGTLAGSVLTMNKAVANFMENTGCELHQAIYCATAAPAALLGLSGKGRIEQGFDADLVLLTKSFDVKTVFVGGAKM